MSNSHQRANDGNHAGQDGFKDFKQYRIIFCLANHGLGDKDEAIQHTKDRSNQTGDKAHLSPKLAKSVPIFRGSSACRHCKFLLSQGLLYKFQMLHIEAVHTQAFPNFVGLGKGIGMSHGNCKAVPAKSTAPKCKKCSFFSPLSFFNLTPKLFHFFN